MIKNVFTAVNHPAISIVLEAFGLPAATPSPVDPGLRHFLQGEGSCPFADDTALHSDGLNTISAMHTSWSISWVSSSIFVSPTYAQ